MAENLLRVSIPLKTSTSVHFVWLLVSEKKKGISVYPGKYGVLVFSVGPTSI